jgi:hypothetical protein
MRGNAMSSKKTLNIRETTSSNPTIGGGSNSSSQLRGATLLTNVPSGQGIRTEKAKKPKQVNPILERVVSKLDEAASHVDRALPLRKYAYSHLYDVPEKDRSHYNMRLNVGKKLVTAYDGALAAYDAAIAEMKEINPTVALTGATGNTTGLVHKLSQLGLQGADRKAGKVLNKLIDLRSETYDNKVCTEAWNDFSEALLKTFDANDKAAEVNVKRAERASKESEETEIEKRSADVAEQVMVRTQQKLLKQSQDKYESCLERLVIGPVAMPNGEVAKLFFTNAIGNLFPVRRNIILDREGPEFLIAGLDFRTAYDTFNQDLKDGKLEAAEEKSKSLASVLTKADKAAKRGLEAVEYIDKTIDFYGKAMTTESFFNDVGMKEMSKEKNELQDESTSILERVFVRRRTALALAVQHANPQYEPGLVESFNLLHGTEVELSALHNACYETIKRAAQKDAAPDAKDEEKLKVPDHLLYLVLKDLAAMYEDLELQCQCVLKEFEEKGDAVENNKTVVEHIKGYGDTIAKMRTLIDSELGRVDESEMSEKPKGKSWADLAQEAVTWINGTLRTLFPANYAADDEVNELAEETEELIIDEPAKLVSVPHTASEKKGPTPAMHDPVKDLIKAAAAAEQSVTESADALEILETASQKYSYYAKTGAQAGCSPYTIEKYMGLAATQETKLANKKMQIAKKFQKALGLMATDDTRREAYVSKLDELTAEAKQHKNNRGTLLEEGRSLRTEMSKALAPTHSLFHYLCDQKQVSRVKRTEWRKPLTVMNEKGAPRRNPRTNEPILSYLDEYEIILKGKGTKKFVVHCHYQSKDADEKNMDACHFKTWDQRKLGGEYVRREAKERRDVEVHRGRTNLDTLDKLKKLSKGG